MTVSRQPPARPGHVGPFTYEDLLSVPEDGRRYEVLEGELVVSPPPQWRHQQVQWRLARFLDRAVPLGFGVAAAAPLDVVLTPHDVAAPDLLFIARDREIIAADNVQGAPDLVIEVPSETSRKRDTAFKRPVYERHGVRWYWIVDPEEETVRVFQLRDGRYGKPALFRAGQRLGCELSPGVEEDAGRFFEAA